MSLEPTCPRELRGLGYACGRPIDEKSGLGLCLDHSEEEQSQGRHAAKRACEQCGAPEVYGKGCCRRCYVRDYNRVRRRNQRARKREGAAAGVLAVALAVAWAVVLMASFVAPAAASVIASATSPDGKHLVEIADYDRRQVFEIWQTGLVPPAPRTRLGARVDALRDVSTFAIAPDSSRVVWRDLNTAAGGSRLLSSPWLQVASGISVGLAEVGAFDITCDSQSVQLWGSAVAGGQLTIHCAAITGGAPTPGPCPRVTRCPIFVDGFESGGTGAWR